jgi:hypothetical protein
VTWLFFSRLANWLLLPMPLLCGVGNGGGIEWWAATVSDFLLPLWNLVGRQWSFAVLYFA